MFKKGPDIDKKKLLSKASDVKKDSLTRLRHFKTLIEHLDFNEVPILFKTHFSFIYHTFIDTFSLFDCNSKQKREDLDSILFMLEKILIYCADLIRKRWQFYSITFVMQKLLHQSNTWRLRQEGVRLFIIWYQILHDEHSPELRTIFGSLVPNLVPSSQPLLNQRSAQQTPTTPQSATSLHDAVMSSHHPYNQQLHHSSPLDQTSLQSNDPSSLGPIKLCSIEPLVPKSANDQPPNDEVSFYLDVMLQNMVTQLLKPYWGSQEEARKNQELGFAFLFNMLKKVYLPHIFPGFVAGHALGSPDSSVSPYHSEQHHYVHQYVDEVSSPIDSSSSSSARAYRATGRHPRDETDLRLDLPPVPPFRRASLDDPQSWLRNTDECSATSSVYQAIVIRWLTRIMRQDMLPGQDEFVRSNTGGAGSAERNLQPSASSGGISSSITFNELSSSAASDSNSSTIYQSVDSSSREMEIARRVAGCWPENIPILHELFRRAFFNFYQPASMKRVVNVYKEWICNGHSNSGSSPAGVRQARVGYTSFNDLLQIFVLNSSCAFLIRVQNSVMLDEQVEMCKRIMNIYRYMVMKIFMNSVTWEQLLNVMLSITEHLFPPLPPEKKDITIGGRIAPAFFQTFIVSWIRANLYVHISNKMWNRFHLVMKNLIRWRELIEEWSTTMESLTRVLVKHVYDLNLTDLPLDRPQDRRRRPKPLKSFSTADGSSGIGTASSGAQPQAPALSEIQDSNISAGSATKPPSGHAAIGRATRSGSALLPFHRELNFRGLTRSNSDGCLASANHAKLYFSSSSGCKDVMARPKVAQNQLHAQRHQLRKIKSEYMIFFDLNQHGAAEGVEFRSNSPPHHDGLEASSLKDTNNIMCGVHMLESQPNSRTSEHGSVSAAGHDEKQLTQSKMATNANDQSSNNNNNNNNKLAGKKLAQESKTDKCVLLGGAVRGWTAENSVIMWRRMLGLFGNINNIEDPENHLVIMRCLALILCNFIKARANLGISLDNQTTPKQPTLVPPLTYFVGWLLEATHLPRQYKDSRLLAYKLLCLITIRRHDTELSQQHFIAFYEALHRGLTSPDPLVYSSIVKNCTQLLSYELPGCTFLVYNLVERSRSLLLNSSKEVPLAQPSPRDQAVQVLHTVLALHRPIKKLMVVKPEINNPMNLAAPGDIKGKIFDTLLACNQRPAMLDSATRSRSLCAMSVHLYQEMCDNHESFDIDKLFDALMADMYDPLDSNMFRISCDLLRLFSEHGRWLSQNRPLLVGTIIQNLCRLIVQFSMSANKEPINCLLICLEDWCLSVELGLLLKSIDQLNVNPVVRHSSSASVVSADNYSDLVDEPLAESLLTTVLRSLESIINDEQFLDDTSNKETRGSTKASSSDAQSHSSQLLAGLNPASSQQLSTSGAGSDSTSSMRSRTTIHEPTVVRPANETMVPIDGKPLNGIKLACKATHTKLVTYLNHFPLRKVGAASLSCCADEVDYLTPELASLELAENSDPRLEALRMLIINGNTLVSLVGNPSTTAPSKSGLGSQAPSAGPREGHSAALGGFVRVIVRNLCGKFAWEVSSLHRLAAASLMTQARDSLIDSGVERLIDNQDAFQQDESRSSPTKYDSNSVLQASDDKHGGSSSDAGNGSMSSHYGRDCISELLNQLSSDSALFSSPNGSAGDNNYSSSNSSSSNSAYKKRNSAQSSTNPRFKLAQAEETMIALLTNQRFQELNYCERSFDAEFRATSLAVAGPLKAAALKPGGDHPSEATASSPEAIGSDGFIQCRQLVQNLGYLSWEKRTKVESLGRSARLRRELKNLDAQPARETHKIAVFYIAAGQEDKNSILGNSHGSRAFEDFVLAIGWQVNLATHLGFKGGLQANKSTGETSTYHCNGTTEVMFHVSTRFPLLNGHADDESLNRKLRHLGNDEIHIVWSEHWRDYRRGIIPTEFGDVILAIYPMITYNGYFRIQISCRHDVPPFGPLLDNSIVHQSALAPLVRATAINASRARRLKLPHYHSHYEERSRLIESIAQNHTERLSFEDFATQLYPPPPTPADTSNNNNDQRLQVAAAGALNASCCA